MPTRAQSEKLKSHLGLGPEPVAVSFRDREPAGLPRVARSGPAGCSYWTRAQEGEAFYTLAEDHLDCPIGAHTHGAPMGRAKAEELQGMVKMMVELGYLRMEEVPGIPRRTKPWRAVVYEPLAEASGEPDVVIVRGSARQVMILAEAARAAGVGDEGAAMGRPACAVVPYVLEGGRGALSLGCIGNRVYTGLEEGEIYFALPGRALDAVVERLPSVARANRELESFHRGRLEASGR